jgi:hypothetical protein
MKNQRWELGRHRWRPAGEVIRTAEYDVAEISDAASADFVRTHHYSGEYVAGRFDVGLFRHGRLVGAAVFSHPMNDAVLTNVFDCGRLEAVELGRFVLLDEVPGNGETWFLARAFELVARQKEIRGVISHSDPVPRSNRITGHIVLPGHVGTIYQAHNGTYLGRTKRRTLRILPDGTCFNDRATQKIRKLERNWHGPVDKLVRFGADVFTPEDPAGWLEIQLAKLTRPLRHPGNHRYAWRLDRRLRLKVESTQPYPKTIDVGG